MLYQHAGKKYMVLRGILWFQVAGVGASRL